MKKIILIPAILSCLSGFAQLTLKRADKYFEKLDYKKAAYFYEAYLFGKDDAYSQLQLAKIYTHLNNSVEAEKWYREFIDRDDLEPVHYLNYAQALSSIGKYQEAIPYYQKYQQFAKDKTLATEKVYGIEHINDFFRDSASMKVFNMKDWNSVESDFAPSSYLQSVAFVSGRGTAFGIQRKFAWNNKNYYNIFFVDAEKKIKKFNKNVNSKYHEGASSYSADGNEIYFTRNNFNKGRFGRSNKGINMMKIYHAVKDNQGSWGKAEEVKISSDDYSVGDPCLSSDGNSLYFISDKPGGFGGTDIYVVQKSGGVWGEPINIGHEVNSEGNERTPFLLGNTLYFASEGHFGLGGLDTYSASVSNSTYSGVQNLGAPANSMGDDFGLFVDEKGDGYFSSDRSGGKGSDDIYGIHVEPNPSLKVKGISYWREQNADIYNRKNAPFASVSIKNLKSGDVNEIETNENGQFETELKSGSSYEIIVSKDTLIPSVAMIDLTDKSRKSVSDLEMILVQKAPKKKNITISGQLLDNKTKAPISNAVMFLNNAATGEVKQVPVNQDGMYSIDVIENNSFQAKVSAPGYLIDCFSFKAPAATSDSYKIEEPIYLNKLALNTKLEVENLYYDVNKFEIRPDAALELDKVVQFMTDNTGITVELGAHTDSRGSNAANQTLSENRAKAAHDYIVSKGISDENISYKGYGEIQPLNKCKDGVKCTDEQYGLNRRTEIKITGIKKEAAETVSLNRDNAFSNGQSSCQETIVVKK